MRLAIVVVAAALAATACGSGSRLSRADYAKRADEICADYNKKISALPQPKSLAELQSFTAKAVPITTETTKKLEKLKPPEDEQNIADKWNEANSQVLAAMKKIAAAAKKNDRTTITTALADANRANRHSNDLARTLGMKVCAS